MHKQADENDHLIWIMPMFSLLVTTILVFCSKTLGATWFVFVIITLTMTAFAYDYLNKKYSKKR